MKYILICLLAIVISFVLGVILTMLIGKILKRKFSLKKKIILSLILSVPVLLTMTLGYLSIYYHADPSAVDAAFKNPDVNIRQMDGSYYFDGSGSDAALIFYPGAKVETSAYSLLMSGLAEQGIDCFLVKMPFNMALFGKNAADQFIRDYQYDTWIMAGHSMGGLMASEYANDHPDSIDAMILLAAYPTEPIKNDKIALCSIYGSKDGCLNREVYEESKAFWSQNNEEFCIEGGNHAQFGNYGVQDGDGEPEISSDEQQAKTVKIIFDFLQHQNNQNNTAK